MSISVDWANRVIYIPQNFLTHISGSLYELDVNALRLALKDLEDNPDGMAFPDTHRHNTEVTLSGVTYARFVEIINGYTVTFEDGQYAVRCVGANHNLADVKNVNQVSLIIGNSAGLITVSSGSGLSQEEHNWLKLQFDVVKNKKALVKVGNDLHIRIYDSGGENIIVDKKLKDFFGNPVTEPAPGALAQELASSV